MNSEVSITKKMADAIALVCFAVAEFTKHYEQDHPNSAKQLFQCNEIVKGGLDRIANARKANDLQKTVSGYLNAVILTKELYQNIKIPVKSKHQIIFTLTHLKDHLTYLKKAISAS